MNFINLFLTDLKWVQLPFFLLCHLYFFLPDKREACGTFSFIGSVWNLANLAKYSGFHLWLVFRKFEPTSGQLQNSPGGFHNRGGFWKVAFERLFFFLRKDRFREKLGFTRLSPPIGVTGVTNRTKALPHFIYLFCLFVCFSFWREEDVTATMYADYYSGPRQT